MTFGDDNQERAIDVPDNFVERKKTPPKYPSPKPVKVKLKSNQQLPIIGVIFKNKVKHVLSGLVAVKQMK